MQLGREVAGARECGKAGFGRLEWDLYINNYINSSCSVSYSIFCCVGSFKSIVVVRAVG